LDTRGRVDRLEVPVKAHDREQIGRVVPDPVALRRSRGDALLERLVESAQLLLARPERGLGPLAIRDIDRGADQADDLARLVPQRRLG
jgi:hypothetical protein